MFFDKAAIRFINLILHPESILFGLIFPISIPILYILSQNEINNNKLRLEFIQELDARFEKLDTQFKKNNSNNLIVTESVEELYNNITSGIDEDDE